jgi:hypothetical protein
VKVGDLLHSDFATKNPLEPVFEEDARGKKVFFAARWETGAMKKGKWSDHIQRDHSLGGQGGAAVRGSA